MRKYASLQKKAEKAIKKAIKNVIEYHKMTGRTIAIWDNGKVVRLSPFKVGINEVVKK